MLLYQMQLLNEGIRSNVKIYDYERDPGIRENK